MDYKIRLARNSELKQIQNIEQQASLLFSATKYYSEVDQDCLSLDLLVIQQKKNLIWVASDKSDYPVGFAVALILDNYVHLHELSVIPEYGKKGIGTKLTQTVLDWAKEAGFSGVILSTYRDIPWNAPFYKKLGFRVMKQNELGKGLLNIRKNEEKSGLSTENRVFMIFKL